MSETLHLSVHVAGPGADDPRRVRSRFDAICWENGLTGRGDTLSSAVEEVTNALRFWAAAQYPEVRHLIITVMAHMYVEI